MKPGVVVNGPIQKVTFDAGKSFPVDLRASGFCQPSGNEQRAREELLLRDRNRTLNRCIRYILGLV